MVISGLSKVLLAPQLKLGWIAVVGPHSLRCEALARLEWLGDTFLSTGGPVQRALPALLARRAEVQEPLRRRLATGPAVAGAQQPGTPRLQEPCEALLEALGEIGVAEPEVLAVIQPFVGHERPLIRSATCRALLQLTGEPHWGEQLVELLQHQQLQVHRAALMDLGAAGWRPAAAAISATLAENSLKLIALRGLVENGRGEPGEEALLLTMDNLL